VLAWLRDVLEILKEHGIGWALWNLRGAFGILDSGRADVAYADWHGLKLDRKLLDLLRQF
jgi:endoglucanase